MITLSNENTTNLKDVKSIPKIMKSLTKKRSLASEKNKKNRNSLKLLCFHSPTPQTCGIILDLFKEEFKTKTECFPLLCYHLINHISFAVSQPQIHEVMDLLSQNLISVGKKPSKRLFNFYRIYFYLCSYLPNHHDMLIQIITKILITTVDRNKDIFKPVVDLQNQCIQLLVELPNFEQTATDILASPGVIDGIIKIYSTSPDRSTKLNLINFLARISSTCKNLKVPSGIIDVINPKDPLIETAEIADFLIYNQNRFKSELLDLIGKKMAPSTRLIQYKMVELEGPSESLIESITSQLDTSESSLMPLLRLLEKSPRGIVDPGIVEVLYQACQNSSSTVAIIAFICICYISDELEWIIKYFHQTMTKFPYTARSAVVKMLLQSWTVALNDPDGNKTFVLTLFESLLMKYGDCIDQGVFASFLEKVQLANCSDDFLKVFSNTLNKLPATESVIYILFGASMIQDFAEPETVLEFQNAAKEYMVSSGPGLRSFYRMALQAPL